MNNKNDQPKNECEYSGWQGDEHQPAHHTKGIMQLPIVFSIDHAGVHRSFIHAAAVRVSDYTTRHHRSHWGKRDENDEDENDPVENPGEASPDR